MKNIIEVLLINWFPVYFAPGPNIATLPILVLHSKYMLFIFVCQVLLFLNICKFSRILNCAVLSLINSSLYPLKCLVLVPRLDFLLSVSKFPFPWSLLLNHIYFQIEHFYLSVFIKIQFHRKTGWFYWSTVCISFSLFLQYTVWMYVCYFSVQCTV